MDNEKKTKLIKGVLIGVGILAVLAIVLAIGASKRTGSGDLFGWGDTIDDPNAAEMTASPAASETPDALQPDATASADAVTIQVTDIPAAMTVGDTQSLDVTIMPKSADQAWSVSCTDQNIATVAKRDGKLYYKAAKPGNVTITLNHAGKAAKSWDVQVKANSSASNASNSSNASSGTKTSTSTPAATATPTATATPAAQDNTSEVIKAERYANSVACDANVKQIDSASLIGKEEIADQSKYGAVKDANGNWVFADPNAENKKTDTSAFAKFGSSASTPEPSPSALPDASAEPSASADTGN